MGVGRLLSAEEVAKQLTLSTNHIHKLARTRHIRALKFGGKWRFKQEYVDEYLKNCETEIIVRKPHVTKTDDPRMDALVRDAVGE